MEHSTYLASVCIFCRGPNNGQTQGTSRHIKMFVVTRKAERGEGFFCPKLSLWSKKPGWVCSPHCTGPAPWHEVCTLEAFTSNWLEQGKTSSTMRTGTVTLIESETSLPVVPVVYGIHLIENLVWVLTLCSPSTFFVSCPMNNWVIRARNWGKNSVVFSRFMRCSSEILVAILWLPGKF